MRTRKLLIIAAQGWLSLAAPPPDGVQSLVQPGPPAAPTSSADAAGTTGVDVAAETTNPAAAATDAATASTTEDYGFTTIPRIIPSNTRSAVPSASASTIPMPMINVCDNLATNAWAGFSIQQRDLPPPDPSSEILPTRRRPSVEKRLYSGSGPVTLCLKAGDFTFGDYNYEFGNTQTIRLNKNVKYTLIIYASANVKKISTYDGGTGSWIESHVASFNDKLVSYDTWVEQTTNAHFKVQFDKGALPVHGRMILSQLPIAPESNPG